MDKKAKAEAKRARRSQRKLEPQADANPPDDAQDDEATGSEADSTDSTD